MDFQAKVAIGIMIAIVAIMLAVGAYGCSTGGWDAAEVVETEVMAWWCPSHYVGNCGR